LRFSSYDEFGEKHPHGHAQEDILRNRGPPVPRLRGGVIADEEEAAAILAAIEFARRRIKPEGVKITTPADVLPQIRHYADRKQEHFICATVNGANEVINIRIISIGGRRM